MNQIRKPTLFITTGDPAGVGPEVTVKALSGRKYGNVRLVVVGDRRILDRAAMWCGTNLPWKLYEPENQAQTESEAIELLDLANADPAWCAPGVLDPRCGDAAYCYIEEAVKHCLAGLGEGIVTAPINKAALNASGHQFAGHTEILAHLCGVSEVVMLLVSPRLKVSHVSTHRSLRDAIEGVRPERIERVMHLTAEALQSLGIENPRLAVAGLNPHAGEGGLFGQEEEIYIKPALAKLREEGFDVVGPEPPDTVFLRASQGVYDGVVAMYHDQGHIPIKMLGFSEGVNVTLGLPIVRTSVDHGTAFDIAGTGKADPGSMIAALDLAVRMTSR